MINKQLTFKRWGFDQFTLEAGDQVAAYIYTDRLGFEVDPEVVRDFFESLRPKPRYSISAGHANTDVFDEKLGIVVAHFYGPHHVTVAEDHAALLNEREATK